MLVSQRYMSGITWISACFCDVYHGGICHRGRKRQIYSSAWNWVERVRNSSFSSLHEYPDDGADIIEIGPSLHGPDWGRPDHSKSQCSAVSPSWHLGLLRSPMKQVTLQNGATVSMILDMIRQDRRTGLKAPIFDGILQSHAQLRRGKTAHGLS